MNSDSNQLPPLPSTIVPPPAQPVASFQWRAWPRRLLVCNPFFLCSAALLLFGVNRLSADPNFLGEERTKLLFNFGALQFYEFLVVGTGTLLARKRIWYDSALLVVVEHGLLLVPFMLLSQGVLLNPRLGMTLAFGTVTLAALRWFTVHRGYPQFNLPPRALALGAIFLLVNAALPLIYPPAVEKNTDDWAAPNLELWYVVLPILTAGANLLPRPKHYGGLNPERPWLPLFIYTLWLTGTGAHIWCLGYLSKIEFQSHFLAPAALVAAWTMLRRIGDCVPEPQTGWKIALLCFTFLTPFLAFRHPALFEVLVVANAALYWLLRPNQAGVTRIVLRELILASGALMVLGVPAPIAQMALPHFVRVQALILAIAFAIDVMALRSCRVWSGAAAAIAAAVTSLVFWPDAPVDLYLQTAAVVLLAHSLRWNNPEPLARLLQAFAGAMWIADAAIWIHRAPAQTDFFVVSVALALLMVWFLIAWLTKCRRHWIIAASATGVVLCAPFDWIVRQDSPGLMALTVSLVLFGAGVTVAWTRHAWERNPNAAPH